jgi:aryl-alcohol dehydrogenase-like predicted oxidoreductase
MPDPEADMTHPITRRHFTALAGAALLASPAAAKTDQPPVIRAIPRSGETLPPVGLGTARVFDVADEATRARATAVLRALVANGGSLIDTASAYRDAEIVLGEVIAASALREKLFIASKVVRPDAEEFKRTLARLKIARIDLIQLHNVRDPNQSLALFREWKEQGLCRYIGVTSTFHNDFPAVEAVLAREKPDFVQIDYSLDNREVEKRILPVAADVKAAVLTALPFGRARLFSAVRDKQLPDWAREFAGSWGQFFLKFLLADPRVTAVIPGTSKPEHMIDNLGAMRGALPTPEQRQRMIAFAETL